MASRKKLARILHRGAVANASPPSEPDWLDDLDDDLLARDAIIDHCAEFGHIFKVRADDNGDPREVACKGCPTTWPVGP